jgi:predicted TPR repeat methyltransferase
LEINLDFTEASEGYERALALAPGNAHVLRLSGDFAGYMGRFDAALAAARRVVVLDPLDRSSHHMLGDALYAARRLTDPLMDPLRQEPGFQAILRELKFPN